MFVSKAENELYYVTYHEAFSYLLSGTVMDLWIKTLVFRGVFEVKTVLRKHGEGVIPRAPPI
jgi:hypothetical protein